MFLRLQFWGTLLMGRGVWKGKEWSGDSFKAVESEMPVPSKGQSRLCWPSCSVSLSLFPGCECPEMGFLTDPRTYRVSAKSQLEGQIRVRGLLQAGGAFRVPQCLPPCLADRSLTSVSVTVKSTSWEVFAGLLASQLLIFSGSFCLPCPLVCVCTVLVCVCMFSCVTFHLIT